MTSPDRPLHSGRSVVLLLRGLLALALAVCWHWLIVFAAFPIGGAEFHWVFNRPQGGDAAAVYLVAAVYAVSALGLAFFLCTSHLRWRVSIVVGVIVLAATFSLTWVVSSPDPEDLLVIPITGGLLASTAWLLWRVASPLPPPVKVLVAAFPGAWFLWEMYSFPYGSSLPFRRAVLPLVIFYPLVFAIGALALWHKLRRETPGNQITSTP
jgi:hypothetical protein